MKEMDSHVPISQQEGDHSMTRRRGHSDNMAVVILHHRWEKCLCGLDFIKIEKKDTSNIKYEI